MKHSTKLCIILVSVCLALALLAGALLVMPMLTADDPADTDPPALTDTEGAGSLYVEDTTSRDEESRGPSEVLSDDYIHSETVEYASKTYVVLTFDCEPGETVEVQAGWNCLNLIDLSYDDQTEFHIALLTGETNGKHTSLLNMDPSESRIQVTVPYLEDVILEFTIYDEERRVTGVGSMLVARFCPQAMEEMELDPSWFTVIRSTILGSVRFEDPDAVTGEQVQTLFDEFSEKADEAVESLDFTPVTPQEKLFAIYAEIVEKVLAEDGKIVRGHKGRDDMNDYSFFGTEHQNGNDHEFIIFADGTWTEINGYDSDEKCTLHRCHADPDCPMTAEKGLHHSLWPGCYVVATDGRVYELVKSDWENGILGTIKLIENQVEEDFTDPDA